ncbi:MAG: MlaD family protein [Verrucomicrobiaceae bacterium]
MEERDKKTELLVGLFLFVGLLLLGVLILQFSSIRELFKGTYDVTLPLPDASGIKEGSPVMLGGSRIGKVSKTPKLNATFTGVTILLDIYKDKRIPKDSKFALGTSGLLGDTFIEIKTSGKETNQYFEENVTIPDENISKKSGLGGLQETAEKVSKQVDAALVDLQATVKDLRVTLKKINDGVLSDDALKDLKETFKHLNSLITRLDEKTLGEQTSTDIKEAIASFKNASKSLDDSIKKMEPAFGKVDGIVEKADKAMTSAESAMKSIDKSAGTIGEVTKDLRSGNGLLPAMLRDEQLKNELKSLISNMRQHGILFYRDDSSKAKETPRPRPPYTGGRP